MKENWDVIIIGAGPGGALAAKKCAEKGLETLLIEKKKIPRDKCCSGMVMGNWGQKLIKEEFGEYPDDLMKETILLDGYGVIVKGAPVLKYDIKTPATWKKYLDTWMCEKAKEAGAEIWDSVKVTDVSQDNNSCTINLNKDGNEISLNSRYAIGADGANSITQRSIFPDFRPIYFGGYRECYEVEIDHPENRFNIFPAMGSNRIFFTHNKGKYMLLEGVAGSGKLKETVARAKQYLIDNHGLPQDIEPVWRDGCAQTLLLRELTSGRFRPASGNVLLLGDAGGLNIPITGEGLTSSLLSGRHAAESIFEAMESSEKAEVFYLKRIDGMIFKFNDIYKQGSKLIKESTAGKDPQAFSSAMLKSWELALNLF